MKAMFEAVISRGDYDLENILRKINEYHITGDLSDNERDDLIRKARSGARNIVDAGSEIGRLWAAIHEMQGILRTLQGSNDESEQEWPSWEQPTGAHDAYYNGDRMTYIDGKRYTCIAPNGVACVWAPDSMPDYWEAYS